MNNYEDKTDDRKETGGAAFPRPISEAPNGDVSWQQAGASLREYAAIHLRIPDSGIAWLDEMIAKAERRDIMIKAMQGFLGFWPHMKGKNIVDNDKLKTCAYWARGMTDAMIAERAKEK